MMRGRWLYIVLILVCLACPFVTQNDVKTWSASVLATILLLVMWMMDWASNR